MRYRLRAGDLMQASALIASVVYDAATRPEMLPRKPKPQPKKTPEAKPEQPVSSGASAAIGAQ
jgi:hypothetical protein